MFSLRAHSQAESRPTAVSSSRCKAPALQNDPSLSPRSTAVLAVVGPAGECFMGLISSANGVFKWNGPLRRPCLAYNSSEGLNVQGVSAHQ